MKIIKTPIRSTISHESLNHCMIFSTHKEKVDMGHINYCISQIDSHGRVLGTSFDSENMNYSIKHFKGLLHSKMIRFIVKYAWFCSSRMLWTSWDISFWEIIFLFTQDMGMKFSWWLWGPIGNPISNLTFHWAGFIIILDLQLAICSTHTCLSRGYNRRSMGHASVNEILQGKQIKI